MALFFTSDTHFDHGNIIKYVNRPFRSVAEMNQTMFKNWARTVGWEDEVYHLGDVALGRGRDSVASAVSVLKTLPGRKYLVPGNHDKHLDILEEAFEILPCIAEIGVQPFRKQKKLVFQLCHFPLLSWDKANKGAIHLHGHVHGRAVWDKYVIRRIDVGVDAWGYAPVSAEKILARVAQEEQANPELKYDNFVKKSLSGYHS